MMGTSEEITGEYAAKVSLAEEKLREPEPVVELPAPQEPSAAVGVRLSVLDDTGMPRVKFDVGESWQAEFDFQVRESAENLVAAVGLATPDGVALSTLWSPPTAVKPGPYRFVADFNLPLAGGVYSLHVGLSAGDTSLYYRGDAAGFSVLPSTRLVQPCRDHGAGFLYPIEAPPIIAL
ncbi:MAG: Wzt carbohydrate-binding domain-containing protein [Phycisphaerae bacterium]